MFLGRWFPVDEKDRQKFIKDFKEADISKKLDMWYYALEQEGLWEEIIAEMSEIAQDRNIAVAGKEEE
jgi:hypothetical protein